MADELDKPNFNFGIEDTHVGSKELLDDLFGSEGVVSKPEDVTPVETPPPVKEKEKKPEKKEEDETELGQDYLSKFLEKEEEEEEEEEVLPVVAKKEEKQEEEETPPEEISQFTALAKDLFKLGVFTTDEEEEAPPVISTPEEFLDRFVAEKKKGAVEIVDNFLGQFGQDYKDAFEAIYVNGVDPKEYFSVYNNIVNFSELDMSQEVNQIAVIKQALSDDGLEPKDIQDEIDQLKNYGDLEAKATRYHKALVKKEAAKLQQLEQETKQELQKKQAFKAQYIQNVQSILQEKVKAKEFDGIPINPKLATELQDFLLTDKWRLPSGEEISDFDRAILELKKPENHVMKVKVALLLKTLEKDPTLSSIQKTGVTKKTDQLFSEVVRQKETRNTKTVEKPKSWFQ